MFQESTLTFYSSLKVCFDEIYGFLDFCDICYSIHKTLYRSQCQIIIDPDNMISFKDNFLELGLTEFSKD